PLLCPGRTLRQLPFVFEQVLEEEVAPLCRCLRPGYFGTAGNGVRTDAGAVRAPPAKPLIFDGAAFRFWSNQRRIPRAVCLAERMTAGNQRNSLFVVHRHAEECLANILRRGDRVGIAVWPFGVDVDQAHLHRAERLGELALAAVTFIAQPRAFRAPEE